MKTTPSKHKIAVIAAWKLDRVIQVGGSKVMCKVYNGRPALCLLVPSDVPVTVIDANTPSPRPLPSRERGSSRTGSRSRKRRELGQDGLLRRAGPVSPSLVPIP